MYPTVTALLVSHDGARWLPAVLEGLAAQTRPPTRVVAVDTDSADGSLDLLRERVEEVRRLPARTSYGAAVADGLGALPRATDDEWVWLLHDDSCPAPDALERLLEAATTNPSADVLGPKLREWPSLRRLLEVGVTISGTGRRETGLERGEYDQGQHDRTRDVLAVNTAGMLVRRHVLERLGLERALPVFGTDVDFGWRAARAGHRTVVVPDAVVFHVEAAHRGVRRTPLTGPHFRRSERRAAIFTLLANGPAGRLPVQVVRLLLGSLVRALGFLLVRSPGEALDELVAVASVYGRPWQVLAARRRRRATATLGHRDVKHLLAPFWLPYRHGLDFVSDVATAVALQAGDISAARRARAETAVETGPVDTEAQSLPEDTGLVARAVRSPVVGLFAVLLLVSLVASRGLFGQGMLSGGALLPAPDGALDWWRLHLSSSHQLGTGSTAPAAPYVLPLGVLGSLLLGKAWLAVDLLMLLSVPLAALGAFRFLQRLTGSRPAALWGGAAYGLLPVLTGAVQEGRLGTVVAALLLPWLAHSALFLSPDGTADRRMRAAWRTSLWLALLAAFVPLALVLAVVLVLVAVVHGLATDRARWASGSTVLPLVLPPLVAFVLLLPWSVAVWTHQGASAWLFEAGLPAPGLTVSLDRLDVLVGRPGLEAAPWWTAAGLVLAAVGALARPDSRTKVLGSWVVLVAALGATALLSGVATHTAVSALAQPLWLGFPLLLAQAAAVTAVAVAGTGIRSRLSGRAFGWRQPVGAALVVVALVTPAIGLVWWGVTGTAGPIQRAAATTVPTYMSDASAVEPMAGVLEVRREGDGRFSHLLLRGPGLRLGEESVLPRVDQQQPLSDLVGRLTSAPEPEDVQRLADFGVGFVHAPAPVDSRLAGNLDTLSGLSTGSAASRGARAWQVQEPPTGDALDRGTDPLRPWLLGAQGLAVLTAAVLAAPTRKVTR